MKYLIQINYYNPILNIGLEDIRNAWFFHSDYSPIKLKTIIHQGLLVYRFPSSGKRISYLSLKKGLVKKKIIIRLPLQLLPF